MTYSSSEEAAIQAVRLVQGSFVSLVLCGSYARGDFRRNSDVDVVQITKQPFASYRHDLINYSVYSEESILAMSRKGNLFALHVIHDGKTIGGHDLLPKLRQEFVYQRNYSELKDEMKRIAILLDLPESFYTRKWRKVESIAKRVVRTFLYAQFAEQRKPEFSMEKISTVLQDAQLAKTFLDGPSEADYNRFVGLQELIKKYCGCHVTNPYLTLEAAIVNAWPFNRRVLQVGLDLLTGEREVIAYEDLQQDDEQ